MMSLVYYVKLVIAVISPIQETLYFSLQSPPLRKEDDQ